ncbi:hypothetical protein DICPUDRAFT_98847 [Dictyostelium purpureum]|uniref:non-specific serine/threonine protein kinase n=1 Tax=Dictyostelium purpureum TaxID=5786 RepID=F0ZU07_DICPU|nr:uncharacterized protein DICPUDRAFT_98847 [Dictyostelium purpureum]EGC32560.1 hypothetical protein DICPUDRAFT_98847 [Dictyostelium purpureum]|eukprot:XP_003290897.1 hypothetical protein DICPUDRAFT_98847 [Dictyostelium purpureum]
MGKGQSKIKNGGTGKTKTSKGKKNKDENSNNNSLTNSPNTSTGNLSVATTASTTTTVTSEQQTAQNKSQQELNANNNGNNSNPSTNNTTPANTSTGNLSAQTTEQQSNINNIDNLLNSNGATEASTSPDSLGIGNGDDNEDEGPEEIIFSKNKQSATKDDFELLTVIGKGSFGKVMQVKKKGEDKIFAMKVLRKDAIIARKQVNHTKSEKTILQSISHPFIVNLHYAFQTKDKLYMVLDFVNGGELFFHLKREGRFSEPRVKIYAAEIVSALDHLHRQDIVYRDLKPENILLDSEGHICITDFGLSKKIETNDGTFTFCGTPEYLAPEVLNGHGHGCAVDWWSLGTLLYEMLTGLPPFYSQNVSMMYQKILNGELKIPTYISPEAKSLLEGLLTREVDKRLGSKGGAEVKKHPWFKNIDWEKLDRKEVEVHFKPKVKSGTDISQIDPLFTQERPMDSLVETSALGDAMGKDNNFEGFTYVADSILKD